MSDYLVIGGWTGRRKIPVTILAETADGFRIKAGERVLLPGRGILKKGQLAFVPKSVIKLQSQNQPEAKPGKRPRPIYARVVRFLATIKCRSLRRQPDP
jgi:hypothetical protein